MRERRMRKAVLVPAVGLLLGCKDAAPESRPAIDAIAFIEGVCDDLFVKAVECGIQESATRTSWLDECVADLIERHEEDPCMEISSEFSRCRTERVPCEEYTETIETMPGTVCYEFRADLNECWEECYPNAGDDGLNDPVCETYPQ